MEIKPNLFDFDRPGLEDYFLSTGEKTFRGRQIVKWIHQLGVVDFQAMTDLSKSLRTRLEQETCLQLPTVVEQHISHDGTYKWLLGLEDSNRIETVFIPEQGRGTLCVSSQVGCSLNCHFCNTAQHGYNRNLRVSEILAQLWVAQNILRTEWPEQRVTNVVFMGMGEPLLNFDNVTTAMNLMMDDFAYGLSKRRVTLSTSGVVPGIDKLAQACSVSLAVSLHASNDQVRNRIIPLNKKYPIKDLLAACQRYVGNSPRKRITMEYVMLAGINDSKKDAHELAKILRTVPSKINLIPFNPFKGTEFRSSSPKVMVDFQNILINEGYTTTIRKTRGDDIVAACGQLAGEFKDRTKRSSQVLTWGTKA